MSEGVIDQAAIARLLDVIGGDEEDLQELIDDFSEDAPALVAQMESAAAAGNTDALRIAAHSLKSNGRDMGAMALADACADLERACKDGDVPNAAERVAAISSEVSRAQTALQEVTGLNG